MKRLIVFRVGRRWFAQAIEVKSSESGSLEQTSWVSIPQSETEIQEFARREGYSIEWDVPSKPEDGPA
jgi:hypothetical protein